jgi:hypothetical protein
VTVTRFTSDDVSHLAKAAALHDLGQGLPSRIPAATLTVRGVVATLVYRLDPGEHARRSAHGLLAVTDLEQLDALLDLPVGLPVPKGELRRQDSVVIGQLPPGCVSAAGGAVTRQIRRPLCVDLAVVTSDDDDWRSGLRKAGQFSTYCTRLLAMTGIPDDIADARDEAAYYGIGLVVNASGDPAIALPPQRFIPTAHTAAGWRFTEQVYSEVVTRHLLPTESGQTF